jgi:integrase
MARAERDALRTELAQKINPAHQRVKERRAVDLDHEHSFERIARMWHAARANRWTAKHRDQVLRSLETNVFPSLGPRRINRIVPRDVLNALQPMIDRGALELAARVRQRVSEVFEFAGVLEGLDGLDNVAINPALRIHKLMPTPPKRHYASMAPDELPGLLAAIQSYRGRHSTKLGLMILLHTFVRPGELRFAKWSEFDLDRQLWRIPAARMKMRRVHLVPLSPEVVALLRELRTLTIDCELLLPGVFRPTIPISDNTFNKALRIMGFQGRQVAHAFRSIASTWLNESARCNRDAIERQLAHEPADEIRAAYNRAEYLEERVAMMSKWSAHLAAFTPAQ